MIICLASREDIMKKYTILFITFLITPIFASASFSRDLYFGIYNDPEVTRLQEFLRSEGFYDGPITGNFLTLTREGVKNFQRSQGIEPVSGYFGPLTRGRANSILSGKSPQTPSLLNKGDSTLPTLVKKGEGRLSTQDLIAQLTVQIQSLQKQIEDLQVKLKKETSVAPSVSPSAPEPASPPVPMSAPAPTPQAVPPKPSALEIKGSADATFPEIATTPFKLGDITLSNGLLSNVEILQLLIKITDDMNSPLNRSRDVFFLIRAGTTTFDTIISRTPFTFLSKDPRRDPIAPNLSTLNLSYHAILKPDEERTISLWIENLELVFSGSLTVELKEVLASETIATSGGFKFTLTK